MTKVQSKKPNTMGTKETTEKGGIRLRQEIGLMEAIALIVGAIIGSGIFISPKGILESVGSPGMSLVIWIICGIIATSGAMTMMELQLAIPSSGSYYIYFLQVLGPIPAFLYLWVHVFIFAPAGYAIFGLAIAKYVTSAIFLDIEYPAPEIANRLIAGVCIWLFVFLNCYNVRILAMLQNIFFFGKIVPLIIVIISGIYYGLLSDSTSLTRVFTFENTVSDPRKVVFALYYGGYTYGGWDALASITEELKHPNKNIPLAVYISIPLVTTIYVLTNVAYLLVLTEEEYLSSDAIGVTFVEKICGRYGWIMSILVSMSILGVLSIYIMTSSRQLFIGARNRQFPQLMAHIKQSRMTPVPAIVFLGTLSLVYMCTSDIFVLIDYTSYMQNLNNLGIIGVFFYLRWVKPDLERPIKVSILHPLLFSCSSLFMVIFPIFTRPVQVAVGISVGLCGLPVYLLFFQTNGDPREKFRLHKIPIKVTSFIQKLFLCLPED